MVGFGRQAAAPHQADKPGTKPNNLFAGYATALVPAGLSDLDPVHLVVHTHRHFVCVAGVFRSVRLGRNLFGTTGMGWTSYLSGVVPYLQIPVLIVGLVAAVALTLRTAHQHGQRSRPRFRSACSGVVRRGAPDLVHGVVDGEAAGVTGATGGVGRGPGDTGGVVRLPGFAPAANGRRRWVINIVAACPSRAGSVRTGSCCRQARRSSCASARPDVAARLSIPGLGVNVDEILPARWSRSRSRRSIRAATRSPASAGAAWITGACAG